MFQEETEGSVCLAFVRTLRAEYLETDAREAALTIQSSIAKVILGFTWEQYIKELFFQLDRLNVKKHSVKV